LSNPFNWEPIKTVSGGEGKIKKRPRNGSKNVARPDGIAGNPEGIVSASPGLRLAAP
jgi:hypothetical protein